MVAEHHKAWYYPSRLDKRTRANSNDFLRGFPSWFQSYIFLEHFKYVDGFVSTKPVLIYKKDCTPGPHMDDSENN